MFHTFQIDVFGKDFIYNYFFVDAYDEEEAESIAKYMCDNAHMKVDEIRVFQID